MASTNRDEISRLELLHAAHPDGLVFPHLADAYRRAGRFAQAESVLNAGLRHHADYSNAHVVLGRLRLDQGKRREAENAFHRVLQLDPDNNIALEFLGRLAAEEGRTEQALAYYRRLASLKPDPELDRRIAALEWQATEARSAQAAPTARGPVRSPESAPDVAEDEDAPLPTLPEPGEVVTETMAELYIRQGLFQRAEAVYRKLLDRDPGNDRLRAKLHDAIIRRGSGGEPDAGPPAPTPSDGSGYRGRETERVPVRDPEPDPVFHPSRRVPGPTIRQHLTDLLAWGADRGSPGPPRPPDAPPSPPAEARRHGMAPEVSGAARRPEAPRAPRPRWRPPSTSLAELDVQQTAIAGAGAQSQALIALTDILVGLLEYRDPFFRGGSSLTRLLATQVAEELGLETAEAVDLALAAVLRDLGRLALGGRLVESPKLSETPEGRRKIERHVDLALQLMEGITLPPQVTLAVRHHHERWDGAGYPDGLAGEDIPLLARILAAVDSFAAMVSPRPYRLPRKVPDAAQELAESAGTQYDPEVVDALLRVVARRDQPHLAFVQRHHILLVGPDQAGSVVTATKLCSAGYLAEVAVDPETARERLRRVPVSALVVSAWAGQGGVESLIHDLRLDPLFASLPIVVVDAGSVEERVRLLESGADVCFPPGVSHGELQGTLGALVRRTVRSREVRSRDREEESPWLALQGDIRDFPLAWLLQVMKYDSRTAGIGIRTATEQGAIYIERGDAVHAQIRGGPKGEAALKAMLHWDKGRFTVQPNAKPRERSIEASIMHLLLTQAVEEDHEAAGIFGAVSDHG